MGVILGYIRVTLRVILGGYSVVILGFYWDYIHENAVAGLCESTRACFSVAALECLNVIT